jgi:hypothetical protein
MMNATTQIPGHFVSRSGFLRADRRAKQRSQTFKFGVITFDPDRRILCVVKNVSLIGALIETDNAAEIPDEFTLAINSEASPRICRVAWKKTNQIAVSFEGARPVARLDPQESDQSGRQARTQNARQERRGAPRRNLNAAGWIRLDGSFGTKECKIVDVSTSGVRLCIPFAGRIPETFTVLFSKHAQGHRVRVIWRRAGQIGAKFI